MNITNENDKDKKLVRETDPSTMPAPPVPAHWTNFRAYFKYFVQGFAETIKKYNDFEYGKYPLTPRTKVE